MSAGTASERSRPGSFSSRSNRTRLRYEPTMSTIFSEPGDLVTTARMRGHNSDVGSGVWSLSKRVPVKPYQPLLKDVYPRSEYTMMSTEYNAPKFFDGKFLTYDYRDMIQQDKKAAATPYRPVVYKPQTIETVQTKKKYDDDVKRKSYVPLHIGNDTTSRLFQGSLHNGTRPRQHLHAGGSKAYEIAGSSGMNANDIDSLQTRHADHSFYATMPDKLKQLTMAKEARVKEHSSSVFPLKYSQAVLSPVPMLNDYMTFGDMNLVSGDDGASSTAGSRRGGARWMDSWFPRADVANTMRFMGKPSFHKTDKNREYVINFHGLK